MDSYYEHSIRLMNRSDMINQLDFIQANPKMDRTDSQTHSKPAPKSSRKKYIDWSSARFAYSEKYDNRRQFEITQLKNPKLLKALDAHTESEELYRIGLGINQSEGARRGLEFLEQEGLFEQEDSSEQLSTSQQGEAESYDQEMKIELPNINKLLNSASN